MKLIVDLMFIVYFLTNIKRQINVQFDSPQSNQTHRHLNQRKHEVLVFFSRHHMIHSKIKLCYMYKHESPSFFTLI